MKTIAEHFSEQNFLSKINGGKTVGKYTPKKVIFRQGDPADSIFYIEKGKVKIGVVSKLYCPETILRLYSPLCHGFCRGIVL
jgi:CRP-like cAMP-binding protein